MADLSNLKIKDTYQNLLQVDGGISNKTIKQAVKAGANINDSLLKRTRDLSRTQTSQEGLKEDKKETSRSY